MKISDEKLIDALLQNGSIRATAKRLGCSPTTIQNRLADSSFRTKYESTKSEILTAAVDKMRSNLSLAVDNLVDIMNDKETVSSVRLQAVDALLRHCLRYIEVVDITTRISKLEEVARNGQL